MKRHWSIAAILSCAGLLIWSTNVQATVLDSVDIGNPTSETGHNLQHWGPIEPATSGGSYGGIADCRPVWAPEDGDDWATVDLDFGNNPAVCKRFTMHHLDGLTQDSFDVYIGGLWVFTYPGDNSTVETWLATTIEVCYTGIQTVKFVSTAPQWSGWGTYGQMCFDILQVEDCPANCNMLDMVDVGLPSSESGHNLVGWGPIEPATSGGSYGGIDNCRPVWAPEDGNNWATLDLDFGTNEMMSKCLTMYHLDGLTQDSFELYMWPQGDPASSQLIYTYPGDNMTTEIWLQTSIVVGATGMQTLEFVSTAPQWSGWGTYGQMCFDIIRVDECPPIKDTVDIGNPTSEAGHNLVGWGPIEPQASGGNYGGIDNCRAVYSPSDNDVWATVDLDFGCCIGKKCLIMEHLDGIAADSFAVYIHPVGNPGASQMIFTYLGDNSTQEIWKTSAVCVMATGLQTVRFVSTSPQWSGWGTYGQMCFNNITVKDVLPVKDFVDIGDPTSETGYTMAGWGPIEPATSGGNYGCVDDCRPVYAPEDNNDWATIELDFGYCTDAQKCLTMYHLDGLAHDSFDVYIYPPGTPCPATPDYTYPGDNSTLEVWLKTSIPVSAEGVQVVKFVSTEYPVWWGWDTWGQMCFDLLKVSECEPCQEVVCCMSELTGIEDEVQVPLANGFTNIAPNPFNPATTISFRLNTADQARLSIYDARGRQVRMLVDEFLPAQEHSYIWNGTDASGRQAASGVYFAKLNFGIGETQIRKISLVK